MPDFVRTLNLVKRHRDATWLTQSQQVALMLLHKELRIPGALNLFGPAGTGKTFLAWHVADTHDFVYLPHLVYLENLTTCAATGVILDNCQTDRQFHRDVLKMLGFYQVRHAILVTRQPILDYTPYVELIANPRDLTKVWDNLASIGLSSPYRDVPNFWHIVNPLLTSWAEDNP